MAGGDPFGSSANNPGKGNENKLGQGQRDKNGSNKCERLWKELSRAGCWTGTRRGVSRSQKVRLVFDSGRMETPFTQIGKTGTGWVEEKGQINFLWKWEELVSLFSSQTSRKMSLFFEALLRDPSH